MPEKCLTSTPILRLFSATAGAWMGRAAGRDGGDEMKFFGLKRASLGALGVMLAACGSGGNSGVNVISGSSKPQPEPIRVLSAEEIRSTLVGRSWQYTAADGNGFVTYNNDGTLTYQDDAKGQGNGTWSAVEGELCQSIGGKPTECGQFKSTGDAFYAGNMRLARS
jgi:Protein of unknown function (DUF995)